MYPHSICSRQRFQRETALLIRGDRVVGSTEGPAPYYYCGDAEYEPFPEMEERSRPR
jgi:hypothetical protein